MADQLDVLDVEKINLTINGQNVFEVGNPLLFFRGFTAEESIESPFVSGCIWVDDPIDFRRTINPFTPISFSYKPHQSSTISFPNINIYKIEKVSDDSETKLTSSKRVRYGLHFISKSYLNTQQAASNRSFETPVSPYVIYSHLCSMIGDTAIPGTVQPKPITHKFTNQRFQECVDVINEKIDAIPKCCYMKLFYIRGSGIGVKMLSDVIFSGPSVGTEFTKYSNQAQLGQNKNSILYNIVTNEIDTVNNPFVNLNVSTYNCDTGNLYLNFNPPVSINVNMNSYKIFNEGFPLNPGQQKKVGRINNPNNDNSGPLRLELAKKYRLVMSAHEKQCTGYMGIPANDSMKIGNRCKLNIPVEVDDSKRDSRGNRNSGNVLITGIRHNIQITIGRAKGTMDITYFNPSWR